MSGQLEGKVAIITGATGGMGAATARLFAAEGAKVVLTDIADDKGRALQEELGANTVFFHHDVTSAQEWTSVVDGSLEAFGKIDILVNNAGIYKRASFEEATEELFDLHYKINLLGPFLGLKAVYELMKSNGGGSIVNVSSISGLGALPGHASYGTSKWGVRGLSKYAAVEFGRHNIRVNSTHPGFIDTTMLLENSQEVEDSIPDVTPLGRKGTVQELAQLNLFLASDSSSYLNGAEIAADGGTSI